MSEPRIIAEVRSQDGWDGMIEAFRLAVEARGTTYENTGDLAGLAPRYVNKLLAPVPVRDIGRTSLGPLLGALAVKLVMVDDDEMMAALAKRMKPRKAGPSRHASEAMLASRRRRKSVFYGNSAWGRVMASRQLVNMTEAQRKSRARKAAKARWRKPRVVEIKGAAAEAIRSELKGGAPTKAAAK